MICQICKKQKKEKPEETRIIYTKSGIEVIIEPQRCSCQETFSTNVIDEAISNQIDSGIKEFENWYKNFLITM